MRLLPRVRPDRPEETLVRLWLSVVISRVLATYAIVQGATVLVYGPDRWARSPALQPALEVPGKTATWGSVLFAAGLIALCGSLTHRMRWLVCGHSLAALWSMFFAVSMASTLVPGSPAPTTGVFVYAVDAVLFLACATTAWHSR